MLWKQKWWWLQDDVNGLNAIKLHTHQWSKWKFYIVFFVFHHNFQSLINESFSSWHNTQVAEPQEPVGWHPPAMVWPCRGV